MAIKSILVHLSADEECDVRLRYAVKVASHFDAEVHGVYFAPSIAPLQPFTGTTHDAGDAVTHISSIVVDSHQHSVERDKRIVSERVNKVANDSRKISWEVEYSHIQEEFGNFCRYHDLAILGHTFETRNLIGGVANSIANIVTEAGCPVIILPDGYQGNVLPQQPLISWNSSRAASRAMSDAIPLLKDANEVTVFNGIDQGRDKDKERLRRQREDLLKYLSLQHINAKFLEKDVKGDSVGDRVLDIVEEAHHDMVIVGAYGHSKLHELILGSTTRSVIKYSRVPVLLSN